MNIILACIIVMFPSNIHCYNFISDFQYGLKYFTISLISEQCDKRWILENIYGTYVHFNLAKRYFWISKILSNQSRDSLEKRLELLSGKRPKRHESSFSPNDGKSPRKFKSELENDLAKYVFGQDLAIDEILSALRRHARNGNPKKPLVLNFHGWPGGGKGYVAEFIVKNWFKKSAQSYFVKIYHAKLDFPLADDIYKYQEGVFPNQLKMSKECPIYKKDLKDQLSYVYNQRLQEELETTVRSCYKSLFIFDEVDKYPPHVLDGIKPYLDYNSAVRGIDFRNAIFIFITNNGESIITNITLKKYLDGVPRADLKKNDFDYALRTATFNDEGGFYRSELIRHHLIDAVVPFLPLEKEHVESCILAEMKHQGGDLSLLYDVIKEVMSEISFGPPKYEIYSIHGCKGIHEKVAAILERHWRRKRRSDF